MTRRSRPFLPIAGLLLGVSLLVGCGDDDAGDQSNDGTVEVTGASIALPAGPNTAIYFTIENAGGDDRLVEARTEVGSAELHETSAGDDGLMRMQPIEGVDIPAGDTVTFQAGGLHVMVFDVAELEEGDTVPVELVFEEMGTITVDATVTSYADVAEG
ncbi:MAG: copper chaperone PCu(A)C [Acidimicrobiales bacterium]|nr:copper chaperone PCu(A)C [Acidimicrobiales bacterium]